MSSIRRTPTNLDRALTAATTLKQVIREVDEHGRKNGRIHITELQITRSPQQAMPDSLWATFTSARSAGDLSLRGLDKRVDAATRMLKAADKNGDGKLSEEEKRGIRGAGSGVASALLREEKMLARLLKRLKAM